MAVIEIDDELRAHVEAILAPGESVESFVNEAFRTKVERLERRAAKQAVLNGPCPSATEVNSVGQGSERRNFYDNHD